MVKWTVRIGQTATPIRTQDRVESISITEKKYHKEAMVVITNPTSTERNSQAIGRVDNAIIQIKRNDTILFEGFIESVKPTGDKVTYTSRSFLSLLGYGTGISTDASGNTEAEYDDKTGSYIIQDLVAKYCTTVDSEVSADAGNIDFTYILKGNLRLHTKKVYDIVKTVCTLYNKDMWFENTWVSNNITIKALHVGKEGSGSSGSPSYTLYGNQHLLRPPNVEYSVLSDMYNRIKIEGIGDGKEKIRVTVDDTTSQTTYGIIESPPFKSNLITDDDTAREIGELILNDKKNASVKVGVELAYYITSLNYGDWVKVVDTHTDLDVTKRIVVMKRDFSVSRGETLKITLGDAFYDYEAIVKGLLETDVEAELNALHGTGNLRITANNPPNSIVRIDAQLLQTASGNIIDLSDQIFSFASVSGKPANTKYKKFLIEYHVVNGTLSYKSGTEYAAYGDAESEDIDSDYYYVPLGEIILHGDSGETDLVAPIRKDRVYDSVDYSYIYNSNLLRFVDFKFVDEWLDTVYKANIAKTYGWFAGGWTGSANTDLIDRLTFVNDTVNTIDRCNLSLSRRDIAGLTDNIYAWFGGGTSSSSTTQNVIDRITLADDTTNALDRCDLSVGRGKPGSVSNMVFGWFAGGGTSTATSSASDIVDRITLADDTTNAIDRCNLSLARHGPVGIEDNIYGWFGGGYKSDSNYSDVIDRITFSDDTTNALDRCNLTEAKNRMAGLSDSTYGWFAGGTTGSYRDTVERITFSVDTTNAIDRCNLTVGRSGLKGVTNSIYGWFAGGYSTGPIYHDTIDRITLGNDTVNAVDRCNLSTGRYAISGVTYNY